VDEVAEVVGDLGGEVAAVDEEAQLHVQVEVESVVGEVGAGDQEGVVIGDRALDVEGAVAAGGVSGTLVEGPGIDGESAGQGGVEGLDGGKR
jgi:hypothetical protein